MVRIIVAFILYYVSKFDNNFSVRFRCFTHISTYNGKYDTFVLNKLITYISNYMKLLKVIKVLFDIWIRCVV